MSNEIIKILDDLAERFGVAIDWTAENVMPYLKELIGRLVTFEIVQSAILIVVSGLTIIGCIISGKKLYLSKKKCLETKEETMFHYWSEGFEEARIKSGMGEVIVATVIAVGIVMVTMFCCNVDELLRWSFIPEFKIIECISDKLTMLGG